MTTAEARTLPMIDFEIEQLRTRAHAEAAFDAIGRTHDNPWRGSLDRLNDLQAERTQLALVERGSHLLRLLEERQQLRAEVARLTDEQQRTSDQLSSLEASPLIVRWRAAPMLADRVGAGSHFRSWSDWYVSGRTPASRSTNTVLYPPQSGSGSPPWPVEILFDTSTEREAVLRWRQLQSGVAALGQHCREAQARLGDLERACPEVAAVP